MVLEAGKFNSMVLASDKGLVVEDITQHANLGLSPLTKPPAPLWGPHHDVLI